MTYRETGYFFDPPPLHHCLGPASDDTWEMSSVMIAMREVSDIYSQGVRAVADAFRQLYEMIDADEERVQRLVAAATAAQLRKNERLTGRIARLEEGLAVKARQVRRLELMVKALNKELKEAREQTRLAREAQLAHILKNSQTSSLPPSTDPHKRTRSLRERSGRKPVVKSDTGARPERWLHSLTISSSMRQCPAFSVGHR